MLTHKMLHIFKLAQESFKINGPQSFSKNSSTILKDNLISTNIENIIELCFSEHNKSKQTFDPWSFGKPSYTLFSDGNIALDVNFWSDQAVTIHDHNFTGAFCVLIGSVKCIEFNYNENTTIAQSLGLGELSITNNFSMNPGDIREIPDYNLKNGHLIYHTKSPTINLVLREDWSKDNLLNIYFYPGLRFAHDKSLRNIIIKKIQLLSFLNEPQIDLKIDSLDVAELFSFYTYRKFFPTYNKEILEKKLLVKLGELEHGKVILQYLGDHEMFLKKMLYI